MVGRLGKRARRFQAEFDGDAVPIPKSSVLADYLMEQFCFGLMSALQGQTLASLAIRDHSESPKDLHAFSAIGTSGLHSSTCYRDMMGVMGPALLSPCADMKLSMCINRKNADG